MNFYIELSEYWLIKMLLFANWNTVKCFSAFFFMLQFRRKCSHYHTASQVIFWFPPEVTYLKLLLNFQHWPNHCKYHACSAWVKICCAICSRRECHFFFPLAKPPSKIDFYFFYSTMAVKETVIFIYSMSFWHKVEVNTENMFEFKALMNKTVP